MSPSLIKEILISIVKSLPQIEFSILFGSVARGDQHKSSDIDIAVKFDETVDMEGGMIQREKIKKLISEKAKIPQENIDIVDIQRVKLSLNSTIAEEGIVLTGDGSLSLSNFYLRTWANEEDFYWRLNNENRALSS